MSDTKYIFVVRKDKTSYSMPVYMGGFIEDIDDWSTWGATVKLSEAIVFNTRKEAEQTHKVLSLLLRSYRLTTIPTKKIFEAKLKGI